MGEPWNPSFSWFGDFRTCPLPKPIIFILGDTRILQISQEYIPNYFQYEFRKSQNFGALTIWKLCKRRVPGIMKIRFKISWRSWIWDQYLPESMKLNFGNMGSVSSKSTLGRNWKLWDFEAFVFFASRSPPPSTKIGRNQPCLLRFLGAKVVKRITWDQDINRILGT